MKSDHEKPVACPECAGNLREFDYNLLGGSILQCDKCKRVYEEEPELFIRKVRAHPG